MSGVGKVLLYTTLLFATGGLAVPFILIYESKSEKREMQRGIAEELRRMGKNNDGYVIVKCKRN